MKGTKGAKSAKSTKSAKGKGKVVGVRHSDAKHADDKAPAEKRIDPSDGNGPFNLPSFVRFHGKEKGEKLWNQAGKIRAAVSAGKPVGTAAVLKKGPSGEKQEGKGNVKGKGKRLPEESKGKRLPEEGKGKKVPEESKGNKSKGKKSKGIISKTGSKDAKPAAVGKGKGKKGEKGPPVEKRIDPSDGNGPYGIASFIRFHGEERGNLLWEEAGATPEAMDEDE